MAFAYRNSYIEIVASNNATISPNLGSNFMSCAYLPKPSTAAWHNFIPSVVLQFIMYAMTLYRLMKSTTSISSPTFIVRFLNEGGPMYFVATAALVYTVVSVSVEDETIRVTGIDS
ncbi:hypothetical protein SERLA73DRAFT_71692 [Serpula lacrymans var. lacrymans S7.3]|uniref:Uncharacterized protein n=1 Tax=Serpula lacrymans var. lacrymans (strain S7.3) TaxID=936435 RepID=F8PS95_SERL3|nr:hypothetical protein SERLA73DRAFT_71692 [Serpula lacrymans var. lacrymans S7.3]